MACPDCDSENIAVYDKDYFECQDCTHLIKRSTYEYTIHKPQKGMCIITSSYYTKTTYGANTQMIRKIDDKKVVNYKTERIRNNEGNRSVGYRIGSWVWDRRDLEMVDENGEEIIEFPIPEPVQFNTNFLDV